MKPRRTLYGKQTKYANITFQNSKPCFVYTSYIGVGSNPQHGVHQAIKNRIATRIAVTGKAIQQFGRTSLLWVVNTTLQDKCRIPLNVDLMKQMKQGIVAHGGDSHVLVNTATVSDLTYAAIYHVSFQFPLCIHQ